jgi:hypothetical protein
MSKDDENPYGLPIFLRYFTSYRLIGSGHPLMIWQGLQKMHNSPRHIIYDNAILSYTMSFGAGTWLILILLVLGKPHLGQVHHRDKAEFFVTGGIRGSNLNAVWPCLKRN